MYSQLTIDALTNVAMGIELDARLSVVLSEIMSTTGSGILKEKIVLNMVGGKQLPDVHGHDGISADGRPVEVKTEALGINYNREKLTGEGWWDKHKDWDAYLHDGTLLYQAGFVEERIAYILEIQPDQAFRDAGKEVTATKKRSFCSRVMHWSKCQYRVLYYNPEYADQMAPSLRKAIVVQTRSEIDRIK
jgi:hypothetical protein